MFVEDQRTPGPLHTPHRERAGCEKLGEHFEILRDVVAKEEERWLKTTADFDGKLEGE